MKLKSISMLVILLSALLIAVAPSQGSPPPEVMKLIFIHHSTGEDWLNDDHGGLGRALGENNYFVSDTNYGWGPDSIGDRTDIPNWVEWFASADTPRYMDALFNESGQNSDYTRTLVDPGGENQIILFKSCFPNSALEGNINDPLNPDGWLTMGNAKYVYTTILEYFATRPDKLFIVITAPPLSDSTYAANARAFNDWLVNDWLVDYPLNNVAVFDFHAVLSGPNNRHRLVNGHVEHFTEPGMNTLFYPTDDDHPAARGDQKATGEFLPLLNYYVNRWQAGDTSAPPVSEPAPAAEADPVPELYPAQSAATSIIDDFEGAAPRGSYGWEAFKDDRSSSKITCAPNGEIAYQGAHSLKINYNVELYSWSTCDLSFDNPQNWSSGEGISFYVYAEQEDTFFNVDLFSENAESRESYVHHVRLDTFGEWEQVYIPWAAFTRVDWEENPNTLFAKADQVSGLAFGFDTPSGSEQAPVGVLYIDELSLGGTGTPSEATAPDVDAPVAQPAPLPCVGGLVFPLGLVGLAFWQKKKRK